jgi:hypothetical protein
MSCLATILAFFLLCFGFVVFGIGQLCELLLYLVELAAVSIAGLL